MPNHPHRRVLCSSRRAFITEHLSPSITESIKTISFASTSSSRSSRCIRAILRPINALWFGSTNDGLQFLLRFPYAFMNSAHKFRVSQSTLSCLSLPKVKQLSWIYSESTLNLHRMHPLWICREERSFGQWEDCRVKLSISLPVKLVRFELASCYHSKIWMRSDRTDFWSLSFLQAFWFAKFGSSIVVHCTVLS